METRLLTRRNFLHTSLTIAASGTVFGRGLLASAGSQDSKARGGVRLGGPVFGAGDDPEEQALAHQRLGYGAAYCPNVALKDPERIRAVREAFAKHNVVIAEVGRWTNLLAAPPEQRRESLEKVTEGLALAEAIGALCCVDIAGSYNPNSWFGPHRDNLSSRFFDESVENARKIIDAVKPKRAKFCYEVMGWSLPDSPEHYLKMIKAVDRKAFAVHLDPCNLINSPEKFYRNTDLLNDCFEKLGRWIVSCHAKDLTWDIEMNVHFREVPPGKGSLDYATYLKRLAQLPQRPPLMLEHLATAEEYTAGREHILNVGRQNGVSFD